MKHRTKIWIGMGLFLIALIVLKGFELLGVDFSTVGLFEKILIVITTLFFAGGFLIDFLSKEEVDKK